MAILWAHYSRLEGFVKIFFYKTLKPRWPTEPGRGPRSPNLGTPRV